MPSSSEINITPVFRFRPLSPLMEQVIANAVRRNRQAALTASAPRTTPAPAPQDGAGLDKRA